MSPQRGDRAAAPRVGEEHDIRLDNADSTEGWDGLARTAPVNPRRAVEAVRGGLSTDSLR